MAKQSEAKTKTMVIAGKTTVTNPFTQERYEKGIPKETPKKKDSWYKSQVDGGYLKEVEV